jgi:hypothetical protein
MGFEVAGTDGEDGCCAMKKDTGGVDGDVLQDGSMAVGTSIHVRHSSALLGLACLAPTRDSSKARDRNGASA